MNRMLKLGLFAVAVCFLFTPYAHAGMAGDIGGFFVDLVKYPYYFFSDLFRFFRVPA